MESNWDQSPFGGQGSSSTDLDNLCSGPGEWISRANRDGLETLQETMTMEYETADLSERWKTKQKLYLSLTLLSFGAIILSVMLYFGFNSYIMYMNDGLMPRGHWSSWSRCDKTCDYGLQVRFTNCTPYVNTNQKYKLNCSSLARSESRKCIAKVCLQPNWSRWSKCDQSCGKGKQYRTKLCGAHCKEGQKNETDERLCFIAAHCPIHGQFTEWSSWSSCSKTCGVDVMRTKKRSCTNPAPQFGGKTCQGSIETGEYCTVPTCDHHFWQVWGQWSGCSNSCGAGNKHRKRICKEGKKCVGTTKEEQSCNPGNCRNFNGTRFFFSKEKSSWSSAANYCKRLWKGDGAMAFIYNEEENNFLLTQLNNNTQVWLGGSDRIGDKWLWSHSNCSISSWNFAKPTTSSSFDNVTAHCLSMKSVEDGAWSIDDCNSQHKFVCKYNTDAPKMCHPT